MSLDVTPDADRPPNRPLREARLDRAWTQAEAARELARLARAHVTRQMISDWERGLTPSLLYQRLLASLYGRTRAQLGLAEGEPAAAPGRLDLEEAGETERRTFLALLSGILPAAFDAECLARALGAPRSIDRRILDDLDTQGQEYGRMYWSMSPASFWPTAYGYAAITRHVHQSSSGALAVQAGAVASRAASLLGMVAHRLHRRPEAVMYLNLAAELADEAGDGVLRAHALVALRSVYSPVTGGQGRTDATAAVRLLDEADEAAGAGAPPLLRTWLLACRAEDRAFLKRAADAARDLEAAERCLAEAPDQRSGFFHHWNSGRLAGFRGNCHVLLEQADQAVDVLESVVRETSPDLIGPYTAVLSDLSIALAQRGEVERACSLLSDVLAAAQRASLPQRAGRVRRIRRNQLAKWCDAPAVRQLDAQLQQFAMQGE